jgi:hypothetical protein
MRESRVSKMLAVVVVTPVLAVTLAVLVFAARELRGETLLSDGGVRNVAEATGSGQASEVLRFLRAGQDPNQVWTVRRDIISSTITEVTALEAAVWSRHVQLMELLDREGAIADEGRRRHLACLANDLVPPVEDIVKYLAPDGPAGCEPGAALAVVTARSGPS